MQAEKVIFQKKGFKLSEVPYNFVVTYKNEKSTYWTSLQTALNWILKNSNFTQEELNELTKNCPERPRRYIRK